MSLTHSCESSVCIAIDKTNLFAVMLQIDQANGIEMEIFEFLKF
jgi:hypothetical protein